MTTQLAALSNCYEKEQKVWGETGIVFQNPNACVRHSSLKEGWYTPRQRNECTHSKIYVVSGSLVVLTYDLADTSKLIHKVTLTAGKSTYVSVGFVHQFHAKTAVELLEIYHKEESYSIPHVVEVIKKAVSKVQNEVSGYIIAYNNIDGRRFFLYPDIDGKPSFGPDISFAFFMPELSAAKDLLAKPVSCGGFLPGHILKAQLATKITLEE